MRRWLKFLIVIAVLVGAGAAGYGPAVRYWQERSRPQFRLAGVDRGDLAYVVNATGVVKPVLSVSVGAFVSGPIVDVAVEFNQPVQKGMQLATIDPRLYALSVDREKANLATRESEVVRARADVGRVEALLQRARNNQDRAQALREENPDFLSDTELDQFTFETKSLEAQLEVAHAQVAQAVAQVAQAEASLKNAETNRDYCEITSPVDGIVIDRKVDEGQTLAAQFQTPEMFVVAPDIEKEIHIHAAIDEADIGLIRDAKLANKSVEFTVDAYPEELFRGVIDEVRFSSTTTQNVVTYPVIVSTSNPDMKLLPGMTANLSFHIENRQGVVRLPNAALRFYPDIKWVREQDRELLESLGQQRPDQEEVQDVSLPAQQKVDDALKRNRRHVWVEDGNFLKAVEVVIGISDYRHSELVSGDLKPGQKLVTGIAPKRK